MIKRDRVHLMNRRDHFIEGSEKLNIRQRAGMKMGEVGGERKNGAHTTSTKAYNVSG